MNESVYIIAEAGVNHNGDLNLAKKLISVAAKSGANAVKFQTFKTESLVSKIASKADYQKNNTNATETQYEMIKKLELSENDHYQLIDHSKRNNIQFLSSPFDLESIDFLNKIGLEIFKIPSGEINNLPYLRKIGKLKKKVVLSTGMSTLPEIEFALNVLTNSGTKKDSITVLHCNTEYPTPFNDVNLNAMITIRDTFKVKIGYSDHTPGIEIPIAAVALGAKVIEKHFTISKQLDGPDHKASIEPDELTAMIQSIRNVEKALGNGIKQPSESEKKNINIARKSIVAAKPIKEGETFTENNITVKRPGNGINPSQWDEIIGKKAKKNFDPEDFISI